MITLWAEAKFETQPSFILLQAKSCSSVKKSHAVQSWTKGTRRSSVSLCGLRVCLVRALTCPRLQILNCSPTLFLLGCARVRTWRSIGKHIKPKPSHEPFPPPFPLFPHPPRDTPPQALKGLHSGNANRQRGEARRGEGGPAKTHGLASLADKHRLRG